MVYGLWVCAASSRRSSIITSKRLQKYDSRDLTVILDFAIDGVCINVLENFDEKMSVHCYDKQETFV